jgi:spermidine/putrescine transport system permease protein
MRWLGWIAAALLAFLHGPLLVLAVFSFNHSRFTIWEGFSLRWYQEALRDPDLWRATGNSLLISLLATGLATASGTMAAYAVWKRKSGWFSATLYLSLATPEVVTGVSLLAFYQWLSRTLDLRLGMHTVVLAHVSFSLAFVVTVVLARLRTMDRTLEEAALDLGATPWAAFRRVTLPLLMPGIGAAALLAFALSFDDYVTTSLVAGVDSETLPMVMYAMARRGANPTLNAISTLLAVSVGLLIVVGERFRSR